MRPDPRPQSHPQLRSPVMLLIVLAATVLAHPAWCASAGRWNQDRFWITFWCPPPATDTNLSAVAADGYNVTWTPETGLDIAHRHGLKAMLQDPLLDPASLDDPVRREQLAGLIERVKGHPALDAYFITDEPGAAAFPALGRLVSFLRERDPRHLAFINLFPTYASNMQLGTTGDTVTAYREHLRQFVDTVRPDLISYDHYHFLKTGDGGQYFLNLAMIREAAAAADLPFLNIIQACTIEKSWRLVNPDELRLLVYTTLAYGGRGLSYFLHWGPQHYGGLYQDGVRTPLADAVAVLNRELAVLGPSLLQLRSVGVYHTAPVPLGGEPVPDTSPVQIEGPGDCVIGLFATRPGRPPSIFMISSRNHRASTTADVRLATGTRRIEEFNRTTGRWRRCRDWRSGQPWPVTLGPGDGRLFRFR